MNGIKKVIKKLWNFAFKTEKGLYLVFGALTTLISLIVFALFNELFDGNLYCVFYEQKVCVQERKHFKKSKNTRGNGIFSHPYSNPFYRYGYKKGVD